MKRFTLFLIFTFSTFFSGFSCFWDYDTIEMERMQFPDVIELISGKFLRHSQEFYQWRIEDRELKLQKYPDSLYLYNDLAVAYSKVGNDKKAIEIIKRKERIKPNDYTTYANLGTFYIHNGQLSLGIEYIDKAIKINPDAHFGREIYQRYLVEYVMQKMKNEKITLPLSSEVSRNFDRFPRYKLDNFYTFLVNKYNSKIEIPLQKDLLPKEELDKAIKGVMGMMKFGNYNSPVLLEALGDLLMANGWKKGARQLAARAYFKASYHSKQTETIRLYEQKVAYVLYHQYTKKKGDRFTIKELEKLLKEEIAEGVKYSEKIRRDEINWIQSGVNPEKEFAKKYYRKPSLGVRIQETNSINVDVENHYQKYKLNEKNNRKSFSKDTVSLNKSFKNLVKEHKGF
ncbi:tetratricopeptide repeat protein [Aquimarina sediminis]|uniref:tetratricopeptide repeat protein n=1 Tax=Aquimarina sediminis TaxID=2070536 RepID=UPI0013E8E9AE|nr:hypothetical protein [Aquimarina sediminis]